MSCVDGSRVASVDLMFGIGRVQSCVRPVDAAFLLTAGPDGIRELGSILLCWLGATDTWRIEPAPGLTGLPSHHIVLTTS
jgi:hypothetical protein